MTNARLLVASVWLLGFSSVLGACGDDDDEGLSEAQQRGVGASCGDDDDCFSKEVALTCLPFKGGYCGLEGCAGDDECPPGSACVQHDDGKNYCFLVCTDKSQCNPTRPPDIEANCSSNVTFIDQSNGAKACVPPS